MLVMWECDSSRALGSLDVRCYRNLNICLYYFQKQCSYWRKFWEICEIQFKDCESVRFQRWRRNCLYFFPSFSTPVHKQITVYIYTVPIGLRNNCAEDPQLFYLELAVFSTTVINLGSGREVPGGLEQLLWKSWSIFSWSCTGFASDNKMSLFQQQSGCPCASCSADTPVSCSGGAISFLRAPLIPVLSETAIFATVGIAFLCERTTPRDKEDCSIYRTIYKDNGIETQWSNFSDHFVIWNKKKLYF